MAGGTVVFVQGGKKNEAAYPWMFFHLHPDKDPATGAVKLVFFDYPQATIKTWNSHVLVRGKPPTAAPDTTVVMPLVDMRLADGTLGGQRPSVLSLYEFIKSEPAASIQSLQVFSHGWMGGPIIWNSAEFDSAGDRMDPLDQQDRDPHDTDFRIRDFFGTNPLAGAEGTKFAAAFAPDPLIKLWGCVAPDGIRPMLRHYVGTPKGPRGDAARKAHLLDYVTAIGNSFPMVMAEQLGLPVWAAPLGYGSEPGSKVPTNRGNVPVKYLGKFPPDLRKDRWWRASWFFRNQDGGARFYENVLKARIDAVDFIEHRKSWFDAALVTATASAEPGLIDSPMDLQRRLTDRIDAMA